MARPASVVSNDDDGDGDDDCPNHILQFRAWDGEERKIKFFSQNGPLSSLNRRVRVLHLSVSTRGVPSPFRRVGRRRTSQPFTDDVFREGYPNGR